MVLRTIANKVGTFEVNGNAVSYLQPLSTFNTQEMDLIQKWYREKVHSLQGYPQVVPAKDINFQSGQVCYAYDVTSYKSFNTLKTMYLEEKLPYYLSLIELAKNKEITLLWNTQNLVVDEETQTVKVLVIDHKAFDIDNDKSDLITLKELIVITLTNLEQVYGRPKRSDFFEQNEEVIQFAEMIYLHLNSLDHMKEYIEAMNREVNERKQREHEELEKQLANKRRNPLFKYLPFLLPKTKKINRLDIDQSNRIQSQNKPSSPHKQKDNNKRFLIGTVAIIIFAILLNLTLTNVNKNALSKEQPLSSASSKTSMETLYLQGLLGQKEKLMDTLDEKEYDSLSEDQKSLLTQLWVEHGEYKKLLEQDGKAISQITEYLTNQNQLKELDRLQELVKVENPHITFAKGVLAKDWDAIINNRNLVELTEERKTYIVKALLQKGEIDTAKGFVSDKASEDDGLMDTVLIAEKNVVELKALQEQQALLQQTIDESTDQKKVTEAEQELNVVKKEITNLAQTTGL